MGLPHQSAYHSPAPNIYRHESRDSLLDGSDPTPNWSYQNRERFTSVGAPPLSPRRSRMYKPHSVWSWSFLLVILLQACIGLGLEAYVFARFQLDLLSDASKQTLSKTIPTYLSLLIFGFLYQLVLAYDALKVRNTIQIIGICLYNLGILVYVAIETDQVHDTVKSLLAENYIKPHFWDDVKPYLIAVPCVVALATGAMSFIAWKLYDEFAWTIYKSISADLRMKRRFMVYQIYISLLKFDFFFFLGFSVQFLVIVSNTTNGEWAATIAALPITIAILFCAAYFVRRESFWGSLSVMFWYFVALGYFVFKLVRMYDSSEKRIEDYRPARKSLTSFAVITILLMIVTIAVAISCMMNFNKGLKQYIYSKPARNSGQLKQDVDGLEMRPDSHGRAGAQVSNRMVID